MTSPLNQNFSILTKIYVNKITKSDKFKIGNNLVF